MLPLRSLGVYSIAIGLAEVLWNVPQSIAPVLMPHVADSTEAKANRATSQFCRLALAGGALLAVGLAFAASIIIPRILPEFRQSVVLVWFLLPGTVAASVFKVLASEFNGRGRPIQTFYPAAIALVACAVAGVLIVPRYGLRGEALVTTGGYLLNSTLYIFAYRRMTATRVLDLFFINSDDLRDARAACVAAWGVLSAHRPSRAIAWAEPPTDSL
jgi:O-antigen/teichoic acid export membrane protein